MTAGRGLRGARDRERGEGSEETHGERREHRDDRSCELWREKSPTERRQCAGDKCGSLEVNRLSQSQSIPLSFDFHFPLFRRFTRVHPPSPLPPQTERVDELHKVGRIYTARRSGALSRSTEGQ